MIRIQVDMQRCQHYGQCVLEAPDVFELDADNLLEWRAEAADDQRTNVEAAMDVCPMQAIRLVD